MKATSILVQSDRFPVVWGDDGDASPPPGHEFANALLKQIRMTGAKSQIEELPADWWEHSNWFFSVTFGGTTYNLTLEPSPDDFMPHTWYIGISKRLGIIKGLFGSSDLSLDVDLSFFRVVQLCTKTVARVGSVECVTVAEAIDRLHGASPNRSEQVGADQPATALKSKAE